jgi:hypothetical protein
MRAGKRTVSCPIDVTARNKVAEDHQSLAKPARKHAIVRFAQIMRQFVLLAALGVAPIGCKEQPQSRFSFPKNPTPLPDPSIQIDIGPVHSEPGQSLERYETQKR